MNLHDFIDYLGSLDLTRLYMHIGVILLCWFLMFFSVLVDMWDGVQTAKFMGERVSSKGLRRTFSKAGDYWRMMLFGLMFDSLGLLFSWYILPYMTMVITVGVLIIEFRSVWEHNKRKHSHAAEIPDIMERIVKCVTYKDAGDVYEVIKEYIKKEEQK